MPGFTGIADGYRGSRDGAYRASPLEITGTRLTVQTFCQTIGKLDSKIKEAPHHL